MKFKMVAAVFKRNKFLRILTMPNGIQWITNGSALYSMSGMPKLAPEMVLNIFDIPEDKQADWNCEEADMPENLQEICTDDFHMPKISLEQKIAVVGWNDNTYLFLDGMDGVFAVDENLIKPLYDDMEYLRFYKCTLRGSCTPAIMCYNALELKAIVFPYMPGEKMAKEFQEISTYYSSIQYKTLLENMRNPPIFNDAAIETGEGSDDDSEYVQETF